MATTKEKVKFVHVEDPKIVVRGFNDFARLAQSVRTKGLTMLGKILVKETRHRIKKEKRSPDGEPWQAWSEGYAATRKRRHSLLVDTKDLMKTIRSVRQGSASRSVGSPMKYAPHVQKVRPFIGLGTNKRAEYQRSLDDWAVKEMGKRGH